MVLKATGGTEVEHRVSAGNQEMGRGVHTQDSAVLHQENQPQHNKQQGRLSQQHKQQEMIVKQSMWVHQVRMNVHLENVKCGICFIFNMVHDIGLKVKRVHCFHCQRSSKNGT